MIYYNKITFHSDKIFLQKRFSYNFLKNTKGIVRKVISGQFLGFCLVLRNNEPRNDEEKQEYWINC